MRGYGQFCPVAKAAEIVAERWTPLVLRELLCGSRRFNDLHRGVPLMSRTLLAERLEQLEDAGIVRSVARPCGRRREYHLTPAGEELRPLIECLGEWGQRWARAQIGAGDLDPGLLMWDIHRRVNLEALPSQPLHQLTVERPPATGTTLRLGHIHRDLHRPAIGRTRAVRACVRVADHLPLALGDEPRVGLQRGGDPLGELGGAGWLFLERGGARLDEGRVDRDAGGGVAVGIGGADCRWLQFR